MMIAAIPTGHAGTAFAMRDPQERRERRQGPRRAARPDAAERIEIDDALEAVGLDAGLPDEATAEGATVTAAAIARRIVAAAERAMAAQARLGSTMVLHLVGPHG